MTFYRDAVKLSGLSNDRKHLFYVSTPESKSEINLGHSRNATKLLAIFNKFGICLKVFYFHSVGSFGSLIF